MGLSDNITGESGRTETKWSLDIFLSRAAEATQYQFFVPMEPEPVLPVLQFVFSSAHGFGHSSKVPRNSLLICFISGLFLAWHPSRVSLLSLAEPL